MKYVPIIVSVLALVILGCERPAEVIVNSKPGVTVTPISPGDSTAAQGSNDSTFVFSADQIKFGGMFELVKIKNFGPLGKVDSNVYARVIVADTARSVTIGGKTFGYYGRHLDAVTVNTVPLTQRRHFVTVPGATFLYGFEYRSALTMGYLPNSTYTFAIADDTLGNVSKSIRATDDLRIVSPKPGQVVSRLLPLSLQWSGGGENMTIVISAWDTASHTALPRLRIEPDENQGSVLVGLRELSLLPRLFHYYVISFVLENRDEGEDVAGYQGRVLVHAAFVYNTYIELR